MPYIKQAQRGNIDFQISELIDELTEHDQMNVGSLNYTITKLCKAFIAVKGRRYVNLNAVVGMLECAKMEFYRIDVAPYEDKKIQENGAVKGSWRD